MTRQSVGGAVTAALVLLLHACRVGPDYAKPALPAHTDAWVAARDDAENADAPPDAWWRLYQDPRLDALLVEALHANRDLAVAQANLQAAAAVVAQARTGRYPSTLFAAGGTYGRDPVTDEILELSGRPPQNVWLFDDALRVGYEIDLFGRVSRAIEAANANAEAVAAARDAVRVIVAAETARAYAAVCAGGEQLTAAHHSLEVIAHETEITVHRHEAGANSEYDVMRAQALESQVRAAIAPLEGRRRAALFELAALLGRTPADGPRELESCDAAPRLAALIPLGDGVALLKRRPDVRQAERRLAAATAQIGVSTADLYPTIRLSAFLGGASTDVTELVKNVGLAWGVGPAISWSFPNQTSARARIRQAQANQAAALAQFDAVVLGALKETEQALALYGAALDNRRLLADAQEKTHRAFGMSHEQFVAGSVSNLDLLSSEQSLVTIDASVAAADATLVQDQIAVFKALGGGWQPEG